MERWIKYEELHGVMLIKLSDISYICLDKPDKCIIIHTHTSPHVISYNTEEEAEITFRFLRNHIVGDNAIDISPKNEEI